VHCKSLRTGCLEDYLDLKGRKRWKFVEDCTVRNFITCTFYEILLGFPSKGT
jgi:hypothetical protein